MESGRKQLVALIMVLLLLLLLFAPENEYKRYH